MFAVNLKKTRIERKISQKTLSALSRVSCGFISELESGKKKPSLDTAEKLAKALNVPLSSLL